MKEANQSKPLQPHLRQTKPLNMLETINLGYNNLDLDSSNK